MEDDDDDSTAFLSAFLWVQRSREELESYFGRHDGGRLYGAIRKCICFDFQYTKTRRQETQSLQTAFLKKSSGRCRVAVRCDLCEIDVSGGAIYNVKWHTKYCRPSSHAVIPTTTPGASAAAAWGDMGGVVRHAVNHSSSRSGD